MEEVVELTAFGDMLEYYAEQDITEWIWPHIDACARHGVIYSDKNTFIMARPVDSSAPIDGLNALLDLSPEHQSPQLTPNHDAWHIVYASGEITNFFDKAPFTLPKLIWQRNGVGSARIYNFNKIESRIHGVQTEKTKSSKTRT